MCLALATIGTGTSAGWEVGADYACRALSPRKIRQLYQGEVC